jgi:hypothetical protein
MADIFIRSYFDQVNFFQNQGITIPSKHSKPSTIKVTEDQFGELEKSAEFRAHIANKSYRIVDSMPRDQVDLIERISAANDAVEAAKKEAEAQKALAVKAKADFEALQAKVDADGGAIPNELLDKLKEEKESAIAEIDEWKVKFKELEAKLTASAVTVTETVVEPVAPEVAPAPEAPATPETPAT